MEWEDRLPLFRVAEYGLEHGHLAAVKERYLRLVPGEQEDFWGKAEKLVFQALAEYTAAASGAGNARRRLFAEDAEQGFALSDLLTHKFDVILMNPPFGEVSIPSRTYLYSNYDNAAQDIYTAFVDSAVQRLSVGGKIGVLSSRLGFYQDLTEGWRDKLVNGAAPLQLFADLGEKVLDGALVEAAAYVLCKGKGTRAEFFDLLSVADKDSALREASKYEGSSASYAVDLSEFAHVPGHRVVYWVSNRWRRSFDSTTPLEEVLQFPRVGLQTGDDLRLLRLWWEAPQSAIGKRWIPFAKGGEYKCFFQPLDLVVNWSHSRSARRQSNSGAYFKPGITYTERTASDISFRFLPEGCIFSPNGVTVGPLEQAKALVGIVVLNTRVARLFIEMCVGSGGVLQPGGVARHYGPRIVAKVPVPTDLFVEDLEVRAHQIWRDFASRDALNETSLFFSGLLQEGSLSEGIEVTAKRQFEGEEEAWIRAIDISYVAEKRYLRALRMESADVVELDRIWGLHPGGLTSDGANGVVLGTDFARLYSLTVSDLIRELVKLKGASRGLTKCTFAADRRLELLAQYFGMHPSILVKKRRELGLLPDKLLVDFAKRVFSYLVGVAVGRWNLNYIHEVSESPAPADRLPKWSGIFKCNASASILISDPGHKQDIIAAIRKSVEESSEKIFSELEYLIGSDLRYYVSHQFFSDHISAYSASRRTAPIYWQLATPSASYSVWLYIHSFTRDTLYQVQNDYAAPKLQYETGRLEAIRSEAGPNPDAKARRELAAQEGFVDELRAFLDEVKQVAPLWNPDLDDGVIINFAPLWRLVPQHKLWQREVKAAWDALCAEEYDWAHLAMHLWPERVVPKCATDPSVAMAHGLEETFWEEDEDGKWQPRQFPLRPVEELVRERSSPAVKAALRSLLEAPVVGPGNGRGKRRSARGNNR